MAPTIADVSAASISTVTAKLLEDYENLVSDVDSFFTLGSAFMVFSMQIGFALLEAGSIRSHLRSILMKNVFDVCLSTFAWYILGYGIAKGPYTTSFMGISEPGFVPENPVLWFFDLSFAATSATIVSGAMAERTKFSAYIAATLIISGVIYPMVCHWVWSSAGFMSGGNPDSPLPLLDFAGCGVVHMTGGVVGLIGAWQVGPRPGAFVEPAPQHMTKKEEEVSKRLIDTQQLWMVVGTMALWTGWYGFNCGSTTAIVGQVHVVGRVAINTTLGAVCGAICAFLLVWIHMRKFLVDKVLMGILSGLVSVTAGAPYIDNWASGVVGFLGFCFMYGADLLLKKLEIDDPVSAFPVHGVCGAWGLLATGLFQKSSLSGTRNSYGAQLGLQLVGIAIIAVWNVVCAMVLFSILKRTTGLRSVNCDKAFMQEVEEETRDGPLGRVTLCFTDIQGSTVLWEADEDVMGESLVMHDATMRTIIKRHGGFEVKTEGDAFMVAFPSAESASKYCIDVQKDLMKLNYPKELYTQLPARVQDDRDGKIVFKGLRVRMGFHTGEPQGKQNPITKRTDYYGRDVNYSARVSSIAAGGQVLLSAASVQDLREHFTDPEMPSSEIPGNEKAPFGMNTDQKYACDSLQCYISYLGRYGLKGINLDPEGEHIFQMTPYGLENRPFPSLKQSEEPATPTQSPAPSLSLPPRPGSRLRGRENKLQREVLSARGSISGETSPSSQRALGTTPLVPLPGTLGPHGNARSSLYTASNTRKLEDAEDLADPDDGQWC